eukprot:3888470-Prymnesium_polylepis.1
MPPPLREEWTSRVQAATKGALERSARDPRGVARAGASGGGISPPRLLFLFTAGATAELTLEATHDAIGTHVPTAGGGLYGYVLHSPDEGSPVSTCTAGCAAWARSDAAWRRGTRPRAHARTRAHAHTLIHPPCALPPCRPP